ncbi:transcriptional-regulating factor 1 [Astyanax mexicanus]|uniref:transcriptional-regulating factor 1 n=1 Tax=Astyanax mexicanus TaxID=7994 RepID=UPI0020CB31A6|nr:transcriptional-regulating factor 1 [Astyanax mexicanus]XP_022528739.2 transcriptional-regulating factor 1 [Astyanax mexicanus]XP_049320001.1 transcriptional-regulating factor 1 [Astyanax mexicanus]
MTENLYDSNGAYSFQNSLSASPAYGFPTASSLQTCPLSPHVNQKHTLSPATPQNEPSLLFDIQHSGGCWDYNPLEKSASSLWGSSSKDEVTEAMGSHFVYPFSVIPHSNAGLASKFNASALQRLDSFSKAFSMKIPNMAFVNSVGEKSLEDTQVPEILLSPQSATPSDGSDREPFSPVAMQSQQGHNKQSYPPINSQHMTDNLYQNHQQYHYGYQQNKQQLRESQPEQVYKLPPYKSQNLYPFQHQGMQTSQNQLTNYSLTPQKQEQRGHYIQQSPLEGPQSAGSPTFGYPEDYKAPEQPAFQIGQGLPLQSPHFKEPQHFHPFPNQSEMYQHQQHHEQAHPAHLLSFKQNASFGDNPLASLNTMPGFPGLKEEACMDLHHPEKRKGLCSSHYQSAGSGVNQTAAQSAALRGGVLHHINSYRQQWTQIHSPDIPDDQISTVYRKEMGMVRDKGSSTKLKCIVCQREFKSLPALNGHMRSHGGFRTHPTAFKTSDGQIQLDPMVLPVSVPVKDYQTPSKLPNSLHHPRQRDLIDTVKACSPQPGPTPKNSQSLCVNSTAGVGENTEKQVKKRYRHYLVPLVISPHKAGLESRGPVLFKSQLRSPGSCGDNVPYTPPPMLSPVRPGSGLFSSFHAGSHCTGTQNVQRVHLCKDSDVDNSITTLDAEDKSSSMKPRINIGLDFQAELPDIQSHSKVADDVHKATLLWTPYHLDNPDNQQRVDDLLKMACSSALPGGGTNTEYALHCFFECRGDVMITLEKLLSMKPLKCTSTLQTNYHYAGSDKWTLQEKRQLNKGLVLYNKDFHFIQKMVKTKSVSQCVEYYCTWKERLRLGKKLSSGPATPGPEKEGELKRSNTKLLNHVAKNQTKGLEFSDLSDKSCAAVVCDLPSSGPMFTEDDWNQISLSGLNTPLAEYSRPKSAQQLVSGSVKSSPSNSTTSGETDSTLIFPCTECGKVFFKVKSRNAHMKTHRQQDDPQFWQLHAFPEQENQTVTPVNPSVTPLQLPTTPQSLPCSRGEDEKTLTNNDAETQQQAQCILKRQNFKK